MELAGFEVCAAVPILQCKSLFSSIGQKQFIELILHYRIAQGDLHYFDTRTCFVGIDEDEDVFVRERAQIDRHGVHDDRGIGQTEAIRAVRSFPHDTAEIE